MRRVPASLLVAWIGYLVACGSSSGSGPASGDGGSDAARESGSGDATRESGREASPGDGSAPDSPPDGVADAGSDGAPPEGSPSDVSPPPDAPMTSYYCTRTVDGSSYCYGDENLVSAQVSSFESTCKAELGTIVAHCPSTGLVGCCTFSGIGAEVLVSCDYTGTAGGDQATCMSMSGSWVTSAP